MKIHLHVKFHHQARDYLMKIFILVPFQLHEVALVLLKVVTLMYS